MSEVVTTCSKPSLVTCDMRKKDGSCNHCTDVTVATEFLLKKLRPKSGTLRGGINLDAVPLIMTEFYRSLTNNSL